MILLTLYGNVTAVALCTRITWYPPGHESLLFCLGVSFLLAYSRLLLPTENKHVFSPLGSLSVLPTSPVTPYLPCVQLTIQEARQLV